MIKIIGIGSPFGDDQLGWKIIERLNQNPILLNLIPQKVHLESSDRPGMRLLELMEGADSVLLIDAVVTHQNPIGTSYRLQNKEIENFVPVWSSHAIGVAEVLKIGRALHSLPKSIVLYGVEIDSNNTSQSISTTLESAMDATVLQIVDEVSKVNLKSN